VRAHWLGAGESVGRPGLKDAVVFVARQGVMVDAPGPKESRRSKSVIVLISWFL
jgi:hypothetical protein